MVYAMILVTDREAAVLRLLLSGDKYGLEIVAGSGGSIKRNSVYVLLGRMEDKALIEGREEPTPEGESGPPRRVYRVTRIGRAELSAYDAAVVAMRRVRR